MYYFTTITFTNESATPKELVITVKAEDEEKVEALYALVYSGDVYTVVKETEAY